MSQVLKYIENKGNSNQKNFSRKKAFFYGSGMIINSLIAPFMFLYISYESQRNGVAIRTVLKAKIFEKSLRISENSSKLLHSLRVMDF